jgi:hypothetical protein
MRGFNPILARHMMVYSDVEFDLHAFVARAANGSGQLQASITGCTALVGNWLWMDGCNTEERSLGSCWKCNRGHPSGLLAPRNHTTSVHDAMAS